MAEHHPFQTAVTAGILLLLIGYPRPSFAEATLPPPFVQPGPSPLLPYPAPPAMPRAQRHEYRHEIELLEEAWHNAMLKGNSAALENLLSDDYTGITAKGAIQTKEQAVNNLKSGALQLSALAVSDRKIRV